MAWCPYCGDFWIVATGQKVKRPVTSRSHNDIHEPIDLTCPDCSAKHDPTDDDTSLLREIRP